MKKQFQNTVKEKKRIVVVPSAVRVEDNMTVQEFKNILAAYNPEAKVKFFTSPTEEIFLLSDYPNGNDDEKTTKTLFIDMGVD